MKDIIINNKKGFSLVELLISIVIGMIIIGAIYSSYVGSLRIFKNMKSVSDNVITKTPSIELIAKYFDRWGVGVASKTTNEGGNPNCDTCPQSIKTIQFGTTNGYPSVSFYGNVYGFGFVKSIASSTTACLMSCRLNNSQATGNKHNCYYVWRKNKIENPIDTTKAIGSRDFVPLGLSTSTRALNPNNADCSGTTLTLTSVGPNPCNTATGTNASVDKDLACWRNLGTGTNPCQASSQFFDVRADDVLHRAPHKIDIFMKQNPSDDNRWWLYVALTDTAPECDYNENGSNSNPIAPVDNISFTGLPLNCNGPAGGCNAVQVTVVFRSQTPNHTGGYDTYTVTRVFGK